MDAAALSHFLARLDALAEGYDEGSMDGHRYGVTRRTSSDGRRVWLYGEALGGADRISFNLYHLADGRVALRPCEMPAAKVIEFVTRFEPARPTAKSRACEDRDASLPVVTARHEGERP